jgi:exodeoxyribonuclease-3
MRVATWNVNSVKARLPRMLSWLGGREPDVLLLQETKSTDADWPAQAFADLGYESAHHGNGRWNGVAVLSRAGLSDLTLGLPGQPLFEDVAEPRTLGVTCGGLRLWSVYLPNGRRVGSPHFAYKLAFFDALREHVARETAALGERPLGVLGDFNVAPTDADVWDIEALAGGNHVSAPEREALRRLCEPAGSAAALVDLMPRASLASDDQRPPYTFWEMRMLGFQKGRGMRIDLALVNESLRKRVKDVWVDRDARKGQGPSDHAPLILDLQPED